MYWKPGLSLSWAYLVLISSCFSFLQLPPFVVDVETQIRAVGFHLRNGQVSDSGATACTPIILIFIYYSGWIKASKLWGGGVGVHEYTLRSLCIFYDN